MNQIVWYVQKNAQLMQYDSGGPVNNSNDFNSYFENTYTNPQEFGTPKLLARRKLVKRKLISHCFPTGTTIGLREEGARVCEN
jgi:hypothetical protein